MKTPLEIEQLSNQALNSLDNLQQVDANNYLYAKIINRMQQRRQTDQVHSKRLMLRLTAALLLFLCINVASFYLLSANPKASGAKQPTGIAAVSQEYFSKNEAYSY